MNKLITIRFFKIGFQIASLSLILLLISSCAVSHRSFNKRKYTSGYFIPKRKIPRTVNAQTIKKQTIEVNALKPKPTVGINSPTVRSLSESKFQKAEWTSKSERNLCQVEQKKTNSTEICPWKIENTPQEKEWFTDLQAVPEKASGTKQLGERERKRGFGYDPSDSLNSILIALGIALVLGVLALVVIEGTVIFYILLTLAGISCCYAMAVLITIPILWFLDAIL